MIEPHALPLRLTFQMKISTVVPDCLFEHAELTPHRPIRTHPYEKCALTNRKVKAVLLSISRFHFVADALLLDHDLLPFTNIEVH